MLATYIEDLVVPLPRALVAKTFRWALKRHSEQVEVVALAMAKSALETGRWKAIHRYNFGNVKAGPEYVGMYTCFWCDEILNGKRVVFYPDGQAGKRGAYEVPPGHPQTRFRAYANAYDGALEYVGFINGPRYRTAWNALMLGEPRAYVHALKAAHYFTADEGPYANAVASLHREFLAVLNHPEPETADVTEEPVDQELARLLVIAGAQQIFVPGYDGHFTPDDFGDEPTEPGGGPPKEPGPGVV